MTAAYHEPEQARAWLWLSRIVLWLALLLAASNSLRNPLFEAPDELLHYQFVRYLLDEGKLPVQPQDTRLTQYHQPPLYYAGGALLLAAVDDPAIEPLRNPFWLSYRPGAVHQDNKAQFLPQASMQDPFAGTALAMHMLRLWSLLLLAGTLLCLRAIARELWPECLRQQTLFLAIAGLNPMLLYIGSAANNDNLVVLLGTIMLFLLVRATRQMFSTGTLVLLSLLWGAAALSKLTGLLLLAPCAVTLLWLAWRDRRWGWGLAAGALIIVVGLLLSGWWFARNLSLYGELFGLERMLDIWGERAASDWDLATLGATTRYALETFWGRFAYGQIVMPTLLYAPFLALTILGLIGLAWRLRQLPETLTASQAGAWLTLASAALIFGLAFGYFMWRNPSGANGRYIFPALAAYAAFVSAGVARLPLLNYVRPAIILFLMFVALYSLGWLVPWTYAAPRTQVLPEQRLPSNGRGELFWQPGMRLLSATLQTRDVSADEHPEARLDACWEAREAPQRNYIFYVHVVDQELNALGRRDTHTGLGNYPTSFWQQGRAFCETYRVPLETSAHEGPQIADVIVGFYDAETREPLSAFSAGETELEFAVVDRLKVLAPVAGELGVAAEAPVASFAEGVQLQAYDWSATTVQPGGRVTLQLYWSAQGPLSTNYTVFAHLLDVNGELLTQDDQLPLHGRYPTDFWGAGEIVGDRHEFVVPHDAPVGASSLRLGLYNLSDNRRLPRLDSDAQLPDAVEIPGPLITK